MLSYEKAVVYMTLNLEHVWENIIILLRRNDSALSAPPLLCPTWLLSLLEHSAGNHYASQGCQLGCFYASLFHISGSEQSAQSYTLGRICMLLFPWPGKTSLFSILELHKPWSRSNPISSLHLSEWIFPLPS